MVIYDSYVTRKPLEFTLIALTILLILLLPVYIYTSRSLKRSPPPDDEILTVSFNEANFFFSSESDLSEQDKKHLFVMGYEGRKVQWKGVLQTCDSLGTLFRMGIDHTGNGFNDVLLTTDDDCMTIPEGDTVTYRMRILDWKVNKFIGTEGEIIYGSQP